MKQYITAGGKELTLFICPKTNHIKIQFATGGEMPPELTGLYTAKVFAEKDIMVYLDKVKDKKKPPLE